MKKRIKKTPWPTKDAMEQVYDQGLWGRSEQHIFYSGEGSHDPTIVVPYIRAMVDFLESFESPLTVCDLGCGDFEIGRQLLPYTTRYIAVDIVQKLIDHHRIYDAAKQLEFHCLDIAEDVLPDADCAILRQVLQHLSNQEVGQVLLKLEKYRYVVLTEHIPAGVFEANKDIISGQGIRLKKKSGLDITAVPFAIKFKEKKELVSVLLAPKKGKIVTTLYTLF